MASSKGERAATVNLSRICIAPCAEVTYGAKGRPVTTIGVGRNLRKEEFFGVQEEVFTITREQFIDLIAHLTGFYPEEKC